jgi:glyoxalase/bleomycin resistance protein/dioxygenase superfamily protein
MGELSFGQPRGAVIQIAYVVADLASAIDGWIRDLRVGPWFRFDGFDGGADATYRGGPSRARVDLAMAFSGHVQIELIQPTDEEPSVYRDTVTDRGYGFHHFGVASDDVEADIAALESNGYEVAFVAVVPTGSRVVYLDGGPGKAGMIELIPTSPAMQDMWGRYYRAAVGWDGTEAVRPFG